MAATQKGIIVGAQSKIIRRFVIPDDDGQLAGHVGPGEQLVTVPIDDNFDLEHARDLVEAVTGVRPPDHRCAVVDGNGDVVGVIAADPALDSIPNCSLILHPNAALGWKRVSGQWIEPPPLVATLRSAVQAAVAEGQPRATIIANFTANGHTLAEVLAALNGNGGGK